MALAVPLRPALRDHESPVAQFLVVRRHSRVMRKSKVITWLLVIGMIALAAVWFWALPPYLTPLYHTSIMSTNPFLNGGHTIEHVRTPGFDYPSNLVRQIWHFRLVQPEWVSIPTNYERWSKVETQARLIVVIIGYLVSSIFIIRRYGHAA